MLKFIKNKPIKEATTFQDIPKSEAIAIAKKIIADKKDLLERLKDA